MRFCPPDRTRAESLNYVLNIGRSGGHDNGVKASSPIDFVKIVGLVTVLKA